MTERARKATRRLMLLAAALILVLLAAACADDPDDDAAPEEPADPPDEEPEDDPVEEEEDEDEDVAEDLGTISILSFNTGMGEVFSVAMEEEGFDEANGFQGEFLRVDAGAATEAFLQGEADVTVQLDLLVATIARNQGEDVSVFYPDFTNTGSIIVRDDSDIESPEDLEGATVGHFGLESGTTSIMRVLLDRDYGIDLVEDTDLVEAGAPALVELLDAGEVDAILNFTPFTEQALVESNGRVLLRADDPEHGFVPGFAAVTTRESWIEENPDQARAVRDAVDDTLSFFIDSGYEVFLDEPYSELWGQSEEVLQTVVDRAQDQPLMTREWGPDDVEAARSFLADVAQQGILFDDAPADEVAVTIEEVLGEE